MLRYVKADLGVEENPGWADAPAQAEFLGGTRRFANSGPATCAASNSSRGIRLWVLSDLLCDLESVTAGPLRVGILTDPFCSRSAEASALLLASPQRTRSWPKTISLNSTRGTALFSARMRSSAPSQLFKTNRPSNAAGNWSLRVPCS